MAKIQRTIDKIVIKPDVGMVVTHHGARDKQGTQSSMPEMICAEPSAEFTKALNAFIAAAVRSTGLGHFEKAFESDSVAKHVNAEDSALAVKAAMQIIGKRVKVKSVQFKYTDTKVTGVKIKVAFTNQANEPIEINTPMIQLDQNIYGWEPKLVEHVDAAILHAREYLAGEYTQIAAEEEEEQVEHKPISMATMASKEKEKEKPAPGKLKVPAAMRAVA